MYDLSHSSLTFHSIFDNSFISYMNFILGKKSSGFFFLVYVHSFCWVHDNFSCLLCSVKRIPFVSIISTGVLKFQSADSHCPPRSLGVFSLGIINSSCKNAETCAISLFMYANSSFDYQISFLASLAFFCLILLNIVCKDEPHALPETDIPLVSHPLSTGVYEWSYLNLTSGIFTYLTQLTTRLYAFLIIVTKYLTKQLRTGRSYIGSWIEKQ